MFTGLLNLILFLVMLGVLVTIHELGHFIAAKVFKVYVFEFAIGFGPKVFRKRKGETYYSLRALPLGGYVAMLGEEESVPDEFKNENIDPKRSLMGVNRGKRAIIMSAGIIMNLILGYGIFLFSNGALKQTAILTRVTLKEDSPLIAAGIKDDDIMQFSSTEIDGQEIRYFGLGKIDQDATEPEYYVVYSPANINNLDFGGQSILLVHVDASDLYSEESFYSDIKAGDVLTFRAHFKREIEGDNEEELTYEDIYADLTYNAELKNAEKPAEGYAFNSLGFSFRKYHYYHTFSETFKEAGKDFVTSLTAVTRGLKSLFSDGLKNVAGPVGIFNISSQTLANQGLGSFLYLWGMISINLALFNLLPFPPLDGWHLLVVAIESITRQEISPKFKQVASLVGALLLIVLTIAIFAKDIFSLIGVFF